MYSEYNQINPDNSNCSEDSDYPAGPDSEYGLEKLFSERLYLTFAINKGWDAMIARFYNIFFPLGTRKGDWESSGNYVKKRILS